MRCILLLFRLFKLTNLTTTSNHIFVNLSNASGNNHKYIVKLCAGPSALILAQRSQLSKCVEEDVVLLDDLDDIAIMQCADLVLP